MIYLRRCGAVFLLLKHLGRKPLAAIAALLFVFPLAAPADGPPVVVQLDATKANPRAIEDATRNRVLLDYRLAWSSIAQALGNNTLDPLQGLFVGAAQSWLAETVGQQRRSGLTTQYLDQSHKVEIVFYAPEGDVIELHDTAHYRMQMLDRGKPIHDEPVVQRYIVLMTPGADRWVIRQLQAVPQF